MPTNHIVQPDFEVHLQFVPDFAGRIYPHFAPFAFAAYFFSSSFRAVVRAFRTSTPHRLAIAGRIRGSALPHLPKSSLATMSMMNLISSGIVALAIKLLATGSKVEENWLLTGFHPITMATALRL